MITMAAYGVAFIFEGLPLITSASADFKSIPTLATGDVRISKDGGAEANLTVLPTVTPSASTLVRVSLSATELTCKMAVVTLIDQTVTKEWQDQRLVFGTFGNVAALYPTLPADVVSLAGDSTAATNQRRGAQAAYAGVVTGATSPSTLIDSGLTQAAVNHWTGGVIIFTTGALKYQKRDILAFDPALDQITFNPLTAAPSVGDQYVIF
jgi:hypothetical protein